VAVASSFNGMTSPPPSPLSVQYPPRLGEGDRVLHVALAMCRCLRHAEAESVLAGVCVTLAGLIHNGEVRQGRVQVHRHCLAGGNVHLQVEGR